MGSDVRFGSKADICAAIRHVRFTPTTTAKADFRTSFTPESGHMQSNWGCPLWIISGHAFSYSITLSARCRNDSGIARPSVLAVLRLTTS